jgi:hypothetical protein
VALDQSALLEVLDAPTAAEVDDRIRQAAQTTDQAPIGAELTAVVGAAAHQRTPERSAQRNGHRAGMLSTTAGDLELRIPKLRAGSFFPSLLERRRRVDQALFAVVMEAYLHGVSTRGATPVSSYRRQTRRLVAPRLLWPCAARSRSSSAIQHANDNTQIEFVDRNVRASVGGTPNRVMVRVSASPSRRLVAAPGWERFSSRASASNSAWATSRSAWW